MKSIAVRNIAKISISIEHIVTNSPLHHPESSTIDEMSIDALKKRLIAIIKFLNPF